MKTVYADIMFIINLIINYLLLFVTAHIATLQILRARLILAAAFGALYAVLSFLPSLSFLILFPIKLLIAAIIVLMAFGKTAFLKAYVTFFVCSVTFAGFCLLASFFAPNAFSAISGGVYYINISLSVLLLSSLFAYTVLRIVFLRRGGAEKNICTVTVKNDGSEITLRALVDTGNSLRDPRTNARVVISDYDTLRSVLPHGARAILDDCRGKNFALAFDKLSDILRFSLIPYKTVGVPFSLLLAFVPDEVYIEQKFSKGTVLAISDVSVSDGSGYNALI